MRACVCPRLCVSVCVCVRTADYMKAMTAAGQPNEGGGVGGAATGAFLLTPRELI